MSWLDDQATVCYNGGEDKVVEATKLVQLEVAESEEAFVRTLAGKLGWKVITGGEGEHTEECQEQGLPEHIAKLRGCLAGIDQADVAGDARLAYLLEKHG